MDGPVFADGLGHNVHLDDLGVAVEQRELAETDGPVQARAQDEKGIGPGAGRGIKAACQRVIVGHQAAGQVAGQDGNASRFDELSQFTSRTRPKDAAAGDDERLFGAAQHRQRLAHQRRLGQRAGRDAVVLRPGDLALFDGSAQ